MAKKLSNFLYKLELFFDELVLVVLSALAIILAIVFILAVLNPDLRDNAGNFINTINTLSNIIFPWVIMLALLIMARELWLFRKDFNSFHYTYHINKKRK